MQSCQQRRGSIASLTKDELEAHIKLAAQAQMHYKNIVETAWCLGREQAGDNGICWFVLFRHMLIIEY